MRLLRKENPWKWGSEEKEAFCNLKRALTETPVLARPDFSKTFIIRIDSSQYAVRAVLTQQHKERNYSTTDREMLAILFAIRKFKCYVEGYHFLVETEHMSLKYLQSIKEPTGRLARWILELQE